MEDTTQNVNQPAEATVINLPTTVSYSRKLFIA